MSGQAHRRATVMTAEEKVGPAMIAKRHRQALRVVREAERFMDGRNELYNPATAVELLAVAKDLDSNVRAMYDYARKLAANKTSAEEALAMANDGKLTAMVAAASAALAPPPGLAATASSCDPVFEEEEPEAVAEGGGVADNPLYASFGGLARAEDVGERSEYYGSPEDRVVALGIDSDPAYQAACDRHDDEFDFAKPGSSVLKPGLVVPLAGSCMQVTLSGAGATLADGSAVQGKVGEEISAADAARLGRLVAYDHLACLRECVGSLNQVTRLLKTFGMVNCPPDFTAHAQVINGYCNVMRDIFGEDCGVGTRSAVGMGSLPNNIPVEIETIFLCGRVR